MIWLGLDFEFASFLNIDTRSYLMSDPRSMAPSWASVAVVSLLAVICSTMLVGCSQCSEERETPFEVFPEPGIPTSNLEAFLDAHYLGLAHMERYEYGLAAKKFEEVLELAPKWIPARLNLAIALLNNKGEATVEKTESGEIAKIESSLIREFERPLSLLQEIIELNPEPRLLAGAHFCRGLIYEYVYLLDEAESDFREVLKIDPDDGHAWFFLGKTLVKDDTGSRIDEVIDSYTKSIALNPYLYSAHYQLLLAYRSQGEKEKSQQFRDQFTKLNPKINFRANGELFSATYGESGKYAQVVNPDRRFKPLKVARPPRFGKTIPVQVTLPEGSRWATRSDIEEASPRLAEVRTRFGAPIIHADFDNDDRYDLYLPASIIEAGRLRDALLLNLGDGRFREATRAFGLPMDRPSVGAAAGDFDADTFIDLILTGVDGDLLLRNQDGQSFVDLSKEITSPPPDRFGFDPRWLDVDQDGDLDLYILDLAVNGMDDDLSETGEAGGFFRRAYQFVGQPTKGSGSPPSRTPQATASDDALILRRTNDRGEEEEVRIDLGGLAVDFQVIDPLSQDRTQLALSKQILGDDEIRTGLGMLDIEGDGDHDLILVGGGRTPSIILNDRVGKFSLIKESETKLRWSPESDSFLDDPWNEYEAISCLVLDLDLDGQDDLVIVDPNGPILAFRNQSRRTMEGIEIDLGPWPIDASQWTQAIAFDADLDMRTDLIGFSQDRDPVILWSRSESLRESEGGRFRTDSLGVLFGPDIEVIRGLDVIDLVGDCLPDLVIRGDGQAPRIVENLGNGNHWITLELGGRWHEGPQSMRTNVHGIGTRVNLNGTGLDLPYLFSTNRTGPGQSVGPFLLGLADRPTVPLIRYRWPDGVLQTEMNVPVDQCLVVAEYSRKTGSCPVVFTWNGERYKCLGDSLAAGALGYLVAPGVVHDPDRDEALLIPPDGLVARNGFFEIAITEPMDELAFLDEAILEVVDVPPDHELLLDERFTVAEPRPSGSLILMDRADRIDPIRSVDSLGQSITGLLSAWDRQTIQNIPKISEWPGYAREHAIELDFEIDPSTSSNSSRFHLVLAGSVSFPYSQTNYAAATAGVQLRLPDLQVLDDERRWATVIPHFGFPAGMPRRMTLDVTEWVSQGHRSFRIVTNLDCLWDEAFLARVSDAPAISPRVTQRSVVSAQLGYRGMLREVMPDGHPPKIYDYDQIESTPPVRVPGMLTRYGRVESLLSADDDQIVVLAAGDDLRIRFDADGLPELLTGWTRRFVLRLVGHCKDADLMTGASQTVGPLPYRAMPRYPYDPETEGRSVDEAYRDYLGTYQTRPASTP